MKRTNHSRIDFHPFYRHSPEMVAYLVGDAELRALPIDAIVSVQPILKDILDGAEETPIPAEPIESVYAMLQRRSEDLDVWITVRELSAEELPVVIDDTPPAGAARQYYRLVVEP